MVSKQELGKVRTLAINEGLFLGWNSRRHDGKKLSERGITHFWEFIRSRFDSVEEVIFVRKEEEMDGEEEAGKVVQIEKWTRKMSNEKDEDLRTCIQRGLEFVRRRNNWTPPSWRVATMMDNEGVLQTSKVDSVIGDLSLMLDGLCNCSPARKKL